MVRFNQHIATLVEKGFKDRTRSEQFSRLREKCSADMFVCLKNIFANDSLDKILLNEYDDLPEPLQENYRHIAALESIGMRVHRQLVMRMLGIEADKVGAVLAGLSGIVDEFDIKPKHGIFGWATRHSVIAKKITQYKFSSLEEMTALFDTVIKHLNPAVQVELQSIRDLCDAEDGIGRLADSPTRQRLFRKLIQIVLAERMPWHRLIREMLNSEEIEDTEYVIRNAIEAVGLDAPIARFQVRLLTVRAERTERISGSDRVALLRQAYELASRNVEKYRVDKYTYRTLCDVAVKLVERGQVPQILDEAIARMRSAYDQILDPDILRELKRFEDIRARHH